MPKPNAGHLNPKTAKKASFVIFFTVPIAVKSYGRTSIPETRIFISSVVPITRRIIVALAKADIM